MATCTPTIYVQNFNVIEAESGSPGVDYDAVAQSIESIWQDSRGLQLLRL